MAGVGLATFFTGCRTPSLPETQPAAPETPQAPPPSPNSDDKIAPPASDSQSSTITRGRSIARTLPESAIKPPEMELASLELKYDTMLSSRSPTNGQAAGWLYRRNRKGSIVGFEFSNHGGNRILTPRQDVSKNLFFTRDFQFHFDDRARQDMHLKISDWSPSSDKTFRLSELMNSVLLFFPRHYLPAIAATTDTYIVTLPTGEEVEFDAKTREVTNGVFREAPVDLNPNRSAREFPRIFYTGRGIMVRAVARGADPRLGTTAIIATGSPTVQCQLPGSCGQCSVAAKELWTQTGAVRFRFAKDQEFNEFLRTRCGFGIPALAPTGSVSQSVDRENVTAR
jgi:hypothetical protein